MSTKNKSSDRGFGERPCHEDGCEKRAQFWSGQCLLHTALTDARVMTKDDLDALRAELVTVVPMSPEERAARRVASSLSTVTHYAKQLREAIARAGAEGATDEQIGDAQVVQS